MLKNVIVNKKQKHSKNILVKSLRTFILAIFAMMTAFMIDTTLNYDNEAGILMFPGFSTVNAQETSLTNIDNNKINENSDTLNTIKLKLSMMKE